MEDRVIDLSLAAAKAVDVWRPGTALVRLEVLSSPAPIADGGRWCVQIGAFHSEKDASKLKEKLQDRYDGSNVIQFTVSTGEWVRLRPQGDDRRMAEEVASKTHVKEGGVFWFGCRLRNRLLPVSIWQSEAGADDPDSQAPMALYWPRL